MNSQYFIKNFELDQEMKTNVGSIMISIESGEKNDVYNTVREGLVQELMYGGIDGNTIQIDYREYSKSDYGTIARPAFSQSVKYDLSKSKIISYRNLEMEIINADGKEIVFLVKKF